MTQMTQILLREVGESICVIYVICVICGSPLLVP
jgi:hypothetical protein